MLPRIAYLLLFVALAIQAQQPQSSVQVPADIAARQSARTRALADLRSLFDQYGESDEGTEAIVDDSAIKRVREVIERDEELKAKEDWSFISADDCSVWIAQDKNPSYLMLVKLPLGKVSSTMEGGAACPTDCAGTLHLRMINNQRAITRLMFLRNTNTGVVWDYILTNEKEIWTTLSSVTVMERARKDFLAAANACRE